MSGDTEVGGPIWDWNQKPLSNRVVTPTAIVKDTQDKDSSVPKAPLPSRLFSVNEHVMGRRDTYRILHAFGNSMNPTYLTEAVSSKSRRVLKDSLPAVPDFDGFRSERSVLNVVEHDALVKLVDMHRLGEQPFFVLQYVEGNDVSERIAKGRVMHPYQAWTLLSTVCDAVIALHGTGIVHRDIKPANIIQRTDGSGALIDLGLARYDPDCDLQAPGTSVGTPQYMSPEQCKGLVCDSRSDVYSLGLVLTELLTGRRVYTAAKQKQVMLQQMRVPMRPPISVHECIPQEVSDVAMRATQKLPEKRYQRVRQFKDALGEAVEKTKDSYYCSC